MRVILFLLPLLMATALFAQGSKQNLMLWGTVVSKETGKPLGDVSLRMKCSGSSSGTDADGDFYLSMRCDSDTLLVYHLGYVTLEIPLDRQVELPLKLGLETSAQQIEEVYINSGYQYIPKERATGSYAHIDAKTWRERPSFDIVSRLEGAANSLLMNRQTPSNPVMQIRGMSTFTNQGMKPLIILDNFPFEGDLNSINPMDIESVTILKDAAASSIWGARAGSGVIVINSVKTKLGQRKTFDIDQNFTFAAKPDLFSANQMSVPDYIDLEIFLYAKGFYNSKLKAANKAPIPEVVELLVDAKDNRIDAAQLSAEIEKLKALDVRNDMTRLLYQPVANQQYVGRFSGTTESASYLFSVGYDNNRAQQIGNQQTRLTLRNNNSFKISPRWKVQIESRYTELDNKTNSPGGYGGFSGASMGLSPYARFDDDLGMPAAINRYHRGRFTDTITNMGLLDWKYRPLDELALSDNSVSSRNVLFVLGTDYKLWDWLTLDMKAQYGYGDLEQRKLYDRDSYFVRNLVNKYSILRDGKLDNTLIPNAEILDGIDEKNKIWNWRPTVLINKSFSRYGSLNAIAGMEIREYKTDKKTEQLYGYDVERLSATALDHTKPFPSFQGIWGSTYIPNNKDQTRTIQRFVSVFSTISYNLQDKYTASFSARTDASNMFGVKTNQKWNPLWSGGLLWHLWKEAFFPESFVEKLSLRATYGISGNIPSNATAKTQIKYSGAERSQINLPSASITSAPDPDLRWEQVSTLNLGLDFQLFSKNSIQGSVEYYTKKGRDLYYTSNLDPVVGLNSQSKNSAGIDTKGVDVTLSGRLQNSNWALTGTLQFSYVDYKVVRNANPKADVGLLSSGSIVFPIVGYNPYALISYKWAGLDPQNGDPRGYVNGEVSADYATLKKASLKDLVMYRTALPPYFAHYRNNFSVGAFSLMLGVYMKFGHHYQMPALNYYSVLQQGELGAAAEYTKRWQAPGDEAWTNVPSFAYPLKSDRDNFYQKAEINIRNASHIKLSEVSLTYRVPARALKVVKAINIYAHVNELNLLLWNADKRGVDPENRVNFRNPIQVSCGANLKF